MKRGALAVLVLAVGFAWLPPAASARQVYSATDLVANCANPDVCDWFLTSLFDAHNVSEQLRKALERKIWLRSGGQIVVDRTEALTVIDVNTARYVGRTSLEDTVVRTNLEAAEEVVRQLRLRDIGGIIIIDFIDMLQASNREEVLRAFRTALARDKTKTQVIGISPLGLVEMTRKNVSEGLIETLSTPCPMCEGRGAIIAEGAIGGAPVEAAPGDGQLARGAGGPQGR